jgi:hypothetical protein
MSNILQAASQMVSNAFGGGKYPIVEVKSTVDGKTYKVRDLPDKQEAANLIARVRIKIAQLYFHVEKQFPDKPQIQFLRSNFKPDANRFFESTPEAEHTSYSVNKGEAVHLCLRQRQQGEQLVDENVMIFVGIHEMAHAMTRTVGHDASFWNNFGFLLEQAEAIGVYKYVNFAAHPVAYCGVKITDSPKYDPKKDASDMSIGTLA